MSLTRGQEKELRGLVAAGQRILAVKRCREITGLGLNEAMQMVNRLAIDQGSGGGESSRSTSRGSSSSSSSSSHSHATIDPKRRQQAEAAAMAALRDGNVLEAVKRYREHAHLGLKEAHDEVGILHLVHHAEGRLNPQVARIVLARLAAGKKDEAITQLMAGAGFDEMEARAFIARIPKLGLARSGCGGCLFALVLVVIFLAIAAYVLMSQNT